MLVVQEFCAATGAQEQTVLAAYDANAPLNLSPPSLRQGWCIMPEDGDGDEEHPSHACGPVENGISRGPADAQG